MTDLMSIAPTGQQMTEASSNAAISTDGHFVVFQSAGAIYVRDRHLSTTQIASVDSSGNASAGSGSASISSDGRFVAFTSGSPSLVANDTNGFSDVFVHDFQSGATVRVNVTTFDA